MDEKGKALVKRAQMFAARKHRGQTRKNRAREKYTTHTSEVAMLVEKSDGTPEEVAAAHLHDTREDTDTMHEEIVVNFGRKVAEIVDGLTDPPQIMYPSHLSTLERKRAQAERVRGKSNSVKGCKLADQISNVRSVAYDAPNDWDPQKTKDYIEGARLVAEACKGVNPYLDGLFDEAYRAATEQHSYS